MRIVLLALVTAAALAGIAASVLDSSYQKQAYQAFATVGARVGDAGNNLVGKDWPSTQH
jgi:hypothetical protein